MTEQEALDALAAALGECTCDTGPYSTGPEEDCPLHGRTIFRAHVARTFLRDHPEAAQALGIGSGIDPRQGGCSTCGHPASDHRPPDGMAEGYCVRCAEDGLGIECERWTP